jgi:hypothetical protein
MELSPSEFESRLSAFQADLNRPSIEVVQKHVLTGSPVALSADEYFTLRHEVAVHFDVQPVEVVLVGSCRTGFTLRDNAEKNRPLYSPIRSGSDLDIAVVSERLFNQFWDDVFAYSQRSSAFRASGGDEFRRTLFRGWVDPRGFPPGRRFEQADHWRQFFDGLSRDRRFGNRRTTARVYRDWVRLAAYQQIAVDRCKRAFRSQSE